MKLLLHACCGPCSLEPLRLLKGAGHNITLAFMNSNIHPAAEYERRRDTLCAWADTCGTEVVEGVYDPCAWEHATGACGADIPLSPDDASFREVLGAGDARRSRCRACYRLRFGEAARFAAAHGFEGISTTLSVSPYQFTDIIAEELGRAGAAYGLAVLSEDFRPFYPAATQRSRDLGMYRQNYCGCLPSAAEAEAGRAERKAARKAAKAASAATAGPQEAGRPS